MTAPGSNFATELASRLAERREQLGMTFPALSQRAGLPVPTVKRILAGAVAQASFDKVAATAEALGMPLVVDSIEPDEFREQAALEKAERTARLVQGTIALEAQAVDRAAYQDLIDRSTRDILRGSARKLWTR